MKIINTPNLNGERFLSTYGSRGEECGACGKEKSYRAHRRWWERIRTKIDGKVPYRCRECGHKEYHWIDPRDLEQPSNRTRHRTNEAN
ncbi:MAG TPA: hypothetical protein VF786_03810 [Terriglobales bacterium]